MSKAGLSNNTSIHFLLQKDDEQVLDIDACIHHLLGYTPASS